MATVQTRQNIPTPDSETPFCYVVTDIETDGPEPGRNSLRSFASVAVDHEGSIISEFEAHLTPLEGATEDKGVIEFFKTQPAEVWRDISADQRKPEDVMRDFVQWIRDLPSQAVFVAHPLAFDGYWIDWYLRKFTGLRISTGAYGGERLFANGGAIDLQSVIMGAYGIEYNEIRRKDYPEVWFGGYVHTHKAIDDARGYAHILKTAFGRMRQNKR